MVAAPFCCRRADSAASGKQLQLLALPAASLCLLLSVPARSSLPPSLALPVSWRAAPPAPLRWEGGALSNLAIPPALSWLCLCLCLYPLSAIPREELA